MSAILARRLLGKYKIANPTDIDLNRIAEDLDIIIEEDDLDGCDGMLQMISDPKMGIITVKKSIKEQGQKRFIVAHEIGHYEDSDNVGQDYQCSAADVSLRNHRSRPEEVAANEFAAELLMPTTLFKSRLREASPSMDLVSALAVEFQTTLTATLRRFISLTDERCAMVCSGNGKVEYSVPSASFGYWIAPGSALRPNSYAIDLFQSGDIQEGMHDVLATAWIKGNKLSSHAQLKEHSIAQFTYNSVLTLLWIDRDIDGTYSLDEHDYDEEELAHFTPDGKRWRW